MHTAGFEAAIPSSQRRQTQALNRAAIQSIFYTCVFNSPQFCDKFNISLSCSQYRWRCFLINFYLKKWKASPKLRIVSMLCLSETMDEIQPEFRCANFCCDVNCCINVFFAYETFTDGMKVTNSELVPSFSILLQKNIIKCHAGLISLYEVRVHISKDYKNWLEVEINIFGSNMIKIINCRVNFRWILGRLLGRS